MADNPKFAVRQQFYCAGCLVALALLVAAGCGEATKPGVNPVTSANTAIPADEAVRWLTDLEQAKKVAAAEGKGLFINFTGLAWCGPCMQLEYDVLTKPEFAPMAEHFVLVRLDYPAGVQRLPQEPPEPSLSWQDIYGVSAVPTVFLADAMGKPYAVTGNIGLKVEPYVEHLDGLRAVHRERDEAFVKAAETEGIEKAKHLAAGLAAMRQAMESNRGGMNSDPLIHFYREQIDEVLKLDSDGAAGLRGPLAKMLDDQDKRTGEMEFYASLDKLYKEQGADAVLKVLEERINTVVSVEWRNKLTWVKLTYLEWGRHFQEALALSREMAADPSLTMDDRFAARRKIAANLRRLDRDEESLAELDAMFADSQGDARRQASVLRSKADYLRVSNRFDEALAVFEKILTLVEPDSEQARTATAWRMNVLARLGRADDAWAAWEEAGKTGWRRPLDATSMMVMIAHHLNEHGGSREAALAAAERAEKALETAVADSAADEQTIASHRDTLERIKAGPKPDDDAPLKMNNTTGK